MLPGQVAKAALHAVADLGVAHRPADDEPDERGSVLTRLEAAERLRRRTPALVVVAGPEALREDFADGLAADRTHLVALR